MPIRKLEYYEVSTKQPISLLDNSILAIDGFWYIRKYLTFTSEEQFNNHHLALKECLMPILNLKKNVSIMWIWDGLEYKQPVIFKVDKSVQFTLSALEKGVFSNRSLFEQEIFVDFTTSFLREHGITVVRAPYSASAQCAYYLKESCVHHVFTKSDALLFKDCTKIISEFEFATSSIQILDRSEMFRLNGLDLESFRRTAFLSGCEFCATHPFYAMTFDLLEIINHVKTNTGISVLDKIAHPATSFTKYSDEYRKAFFCVEFHPVMHLDGVVRPLSEDPCPQDLDLIFGEKQSDFLYAQIFTCSIGVKALNALLFQKGGASYKKSIIGAFEEISSNKIVDANKNDDLFDFLAKKMNVKVNWDGHISKFVQLLSVILASSDVEPTVLAKLISVGSSDKSSVSKGPYAAEPLRLFYTLNDIILTFKDLCNLANCILKLEGSSSLDLNILKVISQTSGSSCLTFVSKNKECAEKMSQVLALLENK